MLTANDMGIHEPHVSHDINFHPSNMCSLILCQPKNRNTFAYKLRKIPLPILLNKHNIRYNITASTKHQHNGEAHTTISKAHDKCCGFLKLM
jgi:hypothetical protein